MSMKFSTHLAQCPSETARSHIGVSVLASGCEGDEDSFDVKDPYVLARDLSPCQFLGYKCVHVCG